MAKIKNWQCYLAWLVGIAFCGFFWGMVIHSMIGGYPGGNI